MKERVRNRSMTLLGIFAELFLIYSFGYCTITGNLLAKCRDYISKIPLITISMYGYFFYLSIHFVLAITINFAGNTIVSGCNITRNVFTKCIDYTRK